MIRWNTPGLPKLPETYLGKDPKARSSWEFKHSNKPCRSSAVKLCNSLAKRLTGSDSAVRKEFASKTLHRQTRRKKPFLSFQKFPSERLSCHVSLNTGTRITSQTSQGGITEYHRETCGNFWSKNLEVIRNVTTCSAFFNCSCNGLCQLVLPREWSGV